MKCFFCLIFIACAISCFAQSALPHWQQLAQPDTIGSWILPAQGKAGAPLWGHKNGIILGIAPTPGPRGLIRIFCPYLDLEMGNVMNFIALEPVVKGDIERGYSELERSSLDNGKNGKRFWSANDSLAISPQDEEYPARGIISKINGEEVLTFFVFSEPFDNGAKVYVRLRLFETRPYEFEITTYTYDGSEELDYFITTATMGNKSRLRTLYLKDGQKKSLEMWPDYKDIHFTERTPILLKDMLRDKKGTMYFIAAPNEKDYTKATYHPTTASHWRYYAKHATQYWIKENPDKDLIGIVNGRYTYWASESPIPGGISFENFELNEPFVEGYSYIFGISPETPDTLIEKIIK